MKTKLFAILCVISVWLVGSGGAPASAADPGGAPNCFYTVRSVGFEEAKAAFDHPIPPCGRSDFLGYSVGEVHGTEKIFCRDLIYEFTEGSVVLTDESRNGGVLCLAEGARYEYRGRTFIEDRFGGPDRLILGCGLYDVTGESGIVYVADFDRSADVYAVMDLILSLETAPGGVETAARISGDVDGDGSVTAVDARLALRAGVGLETALSAEAFSAADANGDGALTAGDAREILRASVGLGSL